jgi:pyruvate/2-oxoglutarate/acetoin dehydrogenase E1 component
MPKGLLLAAIDDPNPVLIFEHKLLYKTKGTRAVGALPGAHRRRPWCAVKAPMSRSLPPRS